MLERILVSKSSFEQACIEIGNNRQISLDCEATGLFPFQGDRLFSIIIGTKDATYYFNYNALPDHLGNYVPNSYQLDESKIPDILSNFSGTIFLHNAKYDSHLLSFEGLDIIRPEVDIHCTMAIGRVEKNNRMNYGLDALGKELGYKKDDTVKKYVSKHKLYTAIRKPNGQIYKKLHYEKIPFAIIVPYGHIDAEITFAIGMHQIKEIARLDKQFADRKYRVNYVFENEKKLTKTLFRMEQSGVNLDTAYVEKALAFEQQNVSNAKSDWLAITGNTFKDSGQAFAKAFGEAGIEYPKTDKGNPCFDKKTLAELDNKFTKIIKRYRTAVNSLNYYSTFLFLKTDENKIHANVKQGGTETGRMSYSDPNLQNLTKVESDDPRYSDPFLVRGSFTAPPNFALFMLDYDQQEYRLMLDYAGELELINKILSGLDVHVATGEMMATTRKEAKTLNFMLLYGGGVAKLCLAICNPVLQERDLKLVATLLFVADWSPEKIKRFANKEFMFKGKKIFLQATEEQIEHDISELHKARAKKGLYNKKIPAVPKFTNGVISAAKKKGFVFNWAGRICNATRGFEYALPNHLIQGGCGDIVKIAMNQIDVLFTELRVKSKMLVQIHDELLFQIHDDEHYLIPKIKKIMEEVYPYNHLPLTVGVDWSKTSWQNKEEYYGAEA